jgi:hypothetical protein
MTKKKTPSTGKDVANWNPHTLLILIQSLILVGL